jgi:amino acid transporter
VAMRRAGSLLARSRDLPEGLGYSIKVRLLGPPLINQQLAEERLSKPLALGVLSCDGISSAAYGTEEILIELVQVLGYTAAFAIVLPMTAVVLVGIALVVLLYREVVSVYTRAGGSYVVARESFGPRIAQVAAVALLIDYVVTVAVQTAAGSAAIVSAFPALGKHDGLLIISVIAILIMCYGNLRGIREAGRTFALPTYLFSGAVTLMIITGLVREALSGLPHVQVTAGAYCNGCDGHPGSGLFTVGAVYVLLRAFANGGSSLTGIEAVSNAVSALRPPEGRNARQVLVIQGSIVAFLIAGISWMAHVTHAIPYVTGVPTVLSQEADLIFGHSVLGRIFFFLVQAGTAAILFTGGNTSFSGFPFLASFVAEDSFLPRWLTKRGHRLVFSNGIIVLTVVSLALLITVGAVVNNLIPFYAIGVFTGFTMAGFGMARYFFTHRTSVGPVWRRHLAISLTGAIYTALVVLIFAVVKFTEGAWLVVIIFPILVVALIRLNREYRMEARVLERIGSEQKRPPDPPTYARRTVYVFVDEFDLATVAALRYARSLRPTDLRAVHLVVDTAQAATLRQDWLRANTGVVLDFVDCPDRRVARAAAELVSAEAALPGVGVTAILPRRSYSPLLGRLLHDRTADKIAGVVSRIPHAAATIVPFDVHSRLETLSARQAAAANGGEPGDKLATSPGVTQPTAPAPPTEAGPGAGRRPAGQPAAGAAAQEGDGAPGPASQPAEASQPTAAGQPERAGQPEYGGRPAARTGKAAVPAPGEAAAAREGAAPGAGETAVAGDTAAGDAAAASARQAADAEAGAAAGPAVAGPDLAVSAADAYDRPVPSPGATEIGSLTRPGRATVEGRIFAVEIRPVQHNSVLAIEIADSTGQLTALFYGRSHVPGLECGARVRFRGPVGMREDAPVMTNPAYELLAAGSVNPPRPARRNAGKRRRGRRRPGPQA